MTSASLPTGQWFVSAEGTSWWFDSGAISLDFAYTGSMGDRPEWELWPSAAQMSKWFAQRFGVRLRATAADLTRAKELRDAVAGAVWDAWAGRDLSRSAVAMIDRHAAELDVPPQLGTQPKPTLDQLLSTLARDAVVMLRDHPERLRQCAAGDCQIVYLDSSRSANRTWCSMQRCGNRNKVRQQRARQKSRSKAKE
ncbi:MAG TPA: CGNR zinc finger domain-containing protein [Nocardioidaceae bacterium]|nr:CGNR zinc finger domain-containing protein [Nocardioidaceae bacterium]